MVSRFGMTDIDICSRAEGFNHTQRICGAREWESRKRRGEATEMSTQWPRLHDLSGRMGESGWHSAADSAADVRTQ